MEIILARHGKSSFDMRKQISGSGLAAALDNYDAAGIDKHSHPPQALRSVIQSSTRIFTSDLPRSLESASRLHPEGDFLSLPLFREAPLPRNFPVPYRLSATAWTVIARVCWFFGYAGDVESYAQVRRRADEAAQHLIQHASDSGRVALIGHGLFNILIAKQLVRKGWSGPKKRSSHHWGWSIYRYISDL